MTLRLRAAVPDDAPGIAAAARESWRATYGALMPAAEIEAALSRFYASDALASAIRACTDRAPARFDVAEWNGRIDGFLQSSPRDDGAAVLWRFYVRPQAQRRGLGRALFARLEQDLVRRRIARIVLRVHAGNDSGLGFYRRQGFRRMASEDAGAEWALEKPLRPLHVLFVCAGNTCRSPLAEALWRDLAPDRCAGSAGLAATPNAPASAGATSVAAEIGLDLTGHRSRNADPELLADTRHVIVMTADQAAEVSARAPAAAPRTQRIGATDIDDPHGGDLAAYRACRDRLEAVLRHLAASPAMA